VANIKVNHYFLLIFPIVSLIQIFYGIHQQTAYFAPGYGFSDIRGSFNNSSIFANFLVLTTLISIYLLYYFFKYSNYSNITRYGIIILLLLTTIIQILVIIYSNSRTAWISFSISLLILMYYLLHKKLYTKVGKHQRIVFTCFIIFLLITFSPFLYHLKKDSANGRLLIWLASINMIMNDPVFGNGVNYFQSNYLHYQAKYLTDNPQSQYSLLADNVHVPFNEPLRILIEQGMVGFFLLILVVVKLFKIKLNYFSRISQDTSLLKSILLAICLISLFSYPNNIIQIKYMLVLTIAFLASSSKLSIKSIEISKICTCSIYHKFNTKFIYTILTLVSFSIISFISFNYLKAYIKWNDTMVNINQNNYYSRVSMLDDLYGILRNDEVFLVVYGKVLNRSGIPENAVSILEKSIEIYPSVDAYIELGISHKMLGNYEQAEIAWKYASKIVPSRIYPLYLMAKMNYEIGNIERGKFVLRHIQNKTIKVMSPEVRELLDKLESLQYTY
jgi:tetratricopeptide (TPR) repeat protein